MGLTFEQRTKIALIERNMTQTELCAEITKRTGLYCDHSLLRKIFSEKTPGTNIREAICEILNISA